MMLFTRRSARHPTDIPLANILQALAEVMRDCHCHSVELQDAISTTLSSGKADAQSLRTFQGLDHVTQVQEDITRLLPALARISGETAADADSLANSVHLISLRDRLFSDSSLPVRIRSRPGDVDFF